MTTVAVIDFETTGMSPDTGGRATEIGVVLLRDGDVVDRYQSLMNAGAWVPPFIEALTGISNEMLRAAPPVERVMAEAADFVGDVPLVAHNAAFDRRFWDAELARIGRPRRQEFACTLLLSRRVHPEAPSHRLGSLVEFHGLPVAGRHHRALADADMAASLLRHMCETLARRFGLARVTHELLREIQAVPRKRMEDCIAQHRLRHPTGPRERRASGDSLPEGRLHLAPQPTRLRTVAELDIVPGERLALRHGADEPQLVGQPQGQAADAP